MVQTRNKNKSYLDVNCEKHLNFHALCLCPSNFIISFVGGDFLRTWQDHCQDEEVLSEYADAMHHLAVDHWTKRPDTRIDWCRDTLLEYFLHGGLVKVLEKDARRAALERQTDQQSPNAKGDSQAKECAACLLKNKNCKESGTGDQVNANGSHMWNKQYNTV